MRKRTHQTLGGLLTAIRRGQRQGPRSRSRLGRLLYQEILHDAVPVLRLQQRLQLRQPQRQVVLAVDHCTNPNDAGGGTGGRTVYL